MSSLNDIIRDLYRRKRIVKVKPTSLVAHLFETKQFQSLFGPSYREIIALLTEGKTFSEVAIIAAELRQRGQLEPIIIDEEGIIIDGGTRANILAALGHDIEAIQLPIRCRESERNLAICTAIALATLKKKGMSDKFRQLAFLLRPGFEKVGLSFSEVLGIDLEVLSCAMPPRLEASVEVPHKVREAVLYWVEKAIEALSLAPQLKTTVEKLMELAPPEEVFRDELSTGNRALLTVRSVAVAKAYLCMAMRLAGTGMAQLNAVMNYDPLHGKAPKSSVVNRLIARLEDYLRNVHGLDREAQFKILVRSAIERVYEAHRLERRKIDKQKLLETTEKVLKEYEHTLKQATPVPAIRVALAISIALRRLGVRDIPPSSIIQTLGAVKGVFYYIKRRLTGRGDAQSKKLLEELGVAK